MILNTIIFSILSVLIVFSTLGYGLVFTNKILQNNQYLNLPIKGIFGIFFFKVWNTLCTFLLFQDLKYVKFDQQPYNN